MTPETSSSATGSVQSSKKSPEESGEDFRPPDASVETEEQCKCVKEISRKSTDVKKVVKNYPSI